jgi:hypothetical protein
MTDVTTPLTDEISRLIAQLIGTGRAPEPPGERLIRWPELRRKVPYCHSQIYALMAEGKSRRRGL